MTRWRFKISALIIAVLTLPACIVTSYAVWEEKLFGYEEPIITGGSWNESEKYFVFSEIYENGNLIAYAVEDYKGLIDNAEIPAYREGKPVTAVKGTFVNNTLLREIVIPSTVTEIGNYAFLNFTRLRKVTVLGTENNLSIGAFAFVNCPSLSEFIIASGRLLYVDSTAFFNTPGIAKPSAG